MSADRAGRRDCGGGAPFCAALRASLCAMRSQKTVPAKNSEAIFWRPRFTWPLRAGKRANAHFACSEGFFCVRCAAPSAGVAVFARPAAVAPVLRCRCLPCALRAQFRLVLAVCLPAVRFVRTFFSYLLPFPFWLLPRKLLFICRSGRDGNFLACPLPWLCSRPEGLVTCCFFAGFCAHCLFFRSVLFARIFSLIFLLFFCPFLPNFFLSNFFSLVAQAATGIPLLVPSRGFVPGLRVLSPAAFSQTFAPIACFPVLRCSRGFSLLFFSCFLPFPA